MPQPGAGAPHRVQSPISGANPHPVGLWCVRTRPWPQLSPAPAGLGLPPAGFPVPPSHPQHPSGGGSLPC